MIVRRTSRELNRGCGDDPKDVVRRLIDSWTKREQACENHIDTRSMIAEEEAGNKPRTEAETLNPARQYVISRESGKILQN